MILALLCFFLGSLVGYNLSQKPKDVVIDDKLRSELAVAENLNVSLKKDLEQAKETIWKLKQEKK
jgi:hypothetical protein